MYMLRISKKLEGSSASKIFSRGKSVSGSICHVDDCIFHEITLYIPSDNASIINSDGIQ
jgi:hypothetical protein